MPYSTISKQNWGKNTKKTAARPHARPKVNFTRPASRKKPPKPTPRAAVKQKKLTTKGASGTRKRPGTGEKIGGFLGKLAENAIGTIFGQGEYTQTLGNEIGMDASGIATNATPAVNSLVRPVNSNIVSRMHGDEEGAVRLVRREFVGTILIKGGVTNYEFKVGPDNKRIFPWLSGISAHWQQYQIMGLAAEYIPTSGAAVTEDPALGQVAMCFAYDTTVNTGSFPEGDLNAMLNYNGAVSMSPAAPGVCYLECDPELNNQPVKLINPRPTQGTPVDYSSQNYYAARLLVLTSGASSGSTSFQAGQLWVTYEMCMYNPRVETTVPNLAPDALTADNTGYDLFLHDYGMLMDLKDHVGPYSNDELFARTALITTLESRLQTPAMVEKYARWTAILRAMTDVRSASSVDSPLLDFIHSTDIYKLMVKIDPPAPSGRSQGEEKSESWDSISQTGGVIAARSLSHF